MTWEKSGSRHLRPSSTKERVLVTKTVSHPHKDDTFVSHRGPPQKIILLQCSHGIAMSRTKEPTRRSPLLFLRTGSEQCSVNTGQGCTTNTEAEPKRWGAAYCVEVFHLENSVRQGLDGRITRVPVSKGHIPVLTWRGLSWHWAQTLRALTKSAFGQCWDGSCERAWTNCKQGPADLV